MYCVYVCVLLPRRNSIPLTAANELWDVISINTTLVSTNTHIIAHTHRHTYATYKYNLLAHMHTCKSIKRQTVNRIKRNFQTLRQHSVFITHTERLDLFGLIQNHVIGLIPKCCISLNRILSLLAHEIGRAHV